LLTGALNAIADGDCPTPSDAINTDRPGVSNSSTVVPYGSFQVESGIDWAVTGGSNLLTGSETRLRLGAANCTEFLIDVPSYVGSINGPHASGFNNVVVSAKRQLPIPFGFDMSATAGLSFPSGYRKISGRGYQPYIQAPWSHDLPYGWSAAGMFTVTWFPSQSEKNPTFGPTFTLGRSLGSSTNMAIEYGGNYNHQRPTHVLDTLGQWRFTNTQQLDFQAGFGLNSSSVDHFFGIGYSFRLDKLFGN
jgi:Putative MetA-pathway of phenol degradation